MCKYETEQLSSTEKHLRSELEFEKAQCQNLRIELNRLRQAQTDRLHRSSPSTSDLDDFVKTATEALQDALRSNNFETLRLVVSANDGNLEKRDIVVRWDRISQDSVVYISACEALTPMHTQDPSDYIGSLSGSKMRVHSIACGDKMVTMHIDTDALKPVDILVSVTLLGHPSQYMFNNSGDHDGILSVEEIASLRMQHMRNLVGFDVGTDEDFVRAVFRRFLRRDPEPAALSTFSQVSREQTLISVIHSLEYAALQGASP